MSFKALAFGYYDDYTDPENPMYGLRGYSILTDFDSNPYFTQTIVAPPPDGKNAVVTENDQVYSIDEGTVRSVNAYTPGMGFAFQIDPPIVDGSSAPVINQLAYRNNRLYVATSKGMYYADQPASDLIGSLNYIPGTYGWDIKHISITSTGRVYCAGTSGTSFTGTNGISGTRAQFAVLNPDHTVDVLKSNTLLIDGTASAWSVVRFGMIVKEGAGTNGADLVLIKPTFGTSLYVNTNSGVGSFAVLGSAGFEISNQLVQKLYLSPTGRIFAFGRGDNSSLKATYSDDNGSTWSTSTFDGFSGSVNLDYVIFGSGPSANKIKIPTQTSADIYLSVNDGANFVFDSRYEGNSGVVDQVFSTSYYVPAAAPSGTAPTDIALPFYYVLENSAIGHVIGSFSTTDAEGGAMTYSLVSGAGSEDNAYFSIDGNQLKVAASINYEAKSTYSIRVRSTDSTSLSFEKQFTIIALGVNESPTSISLSASSLTEGNAVNAVIGTLSATDPDVGDTITFSVLLGSDNFNVSGNQLRASVSFDYESLINSKFVPVTVRASDANGAVFNQAFLIEILNSTSDDGVALVSAQLPVLSSGKAVASIAVDPRVVPVTLGGQALSEGSVIRNTVSGQKFMKSAGGVNAFVAIELAPKAAWSWVDSSDAAWEILQGF